jgi:hypothetical protein
MTRHAGLNVDTTNASGASFGPSDYFSVIVCSQGGLPTAAIDVVLKPLNMPNTSAMLSGQDFAGHGHEHPSQFAVGVGNLSGTTSCPQGVAASANLAALC